MRKAEITRKTNETAIEVAVNLDGTGKSDCQDGNDDDQDSLSTVGKLCEGVDFAPIIADLELVRSNRHMHGENGSVYSVDSDFGFTTESQIRANLHHYPGSFLRRYFQNEWPNMHF